MLASVTDHLHHTGFGIVPSGFDAATIDRIAAEVDALRPRRDGAGARNLFDLALIRELALAPQIMGLVEKVLGSRSAAVAPSGSTRRQMPTGKCRGIKI